MSLECQVFPAPDTRGPVLYARYLTPWRSHFAKISLKVFPARRKQSNQCAAGSQQPDPTVSRWPILRLATSQRLLPHGPWTGRIMAVDRRGSYPRELEFRAGYGQEPYPYNFRRGQAQKLEGRAILAWSVTWAMPGLLSDSSLDLACSEISQSKVGKKNLYCLYPYS